jgi:hypothetical protein
MPLNTQIYKQHVYFGQQVSKLSRAQPFNHLLLKAIANRKSSRLIDWLRQWKK